MRAPGASLLAAALLAAAPPAPAFDLGSLDPLKITEIVTKGLKSLQDVPQSREVEIGRELSAGLLGAQGLVNDPALQAYVNEVGLWLALQTERPDLPWTFGVIDTNTVNAFAAPGGYVFVTKGLFLMLRNEAELAGVLGHEISHVLRRHHLAALQKQLQLSAAADAASILAESNRETVDALVGAGMQLYSKGLDRDDELEADRMGVVIAARGGYDPYGLPAMLLTLNGMSADNASLAFMFSTHPATADRLGALDQEMAGRMDRYSGGAVEADRFRAMQQRLAAANR
ncbi:MAG: M48 family metallopeptidase [Gammaproteobacteria bacterium]|nr:M48 family metallopeptidase [Gammaproteobacteria bacterium]